MAYLFLSGAIHPCFSPLSRSTSAPVVLRYNRRIITHYDSICHWIFHTVDSQENNGPLQHKSPVWPIAKPDFFVVIQSEVQ